MAERLRLEQGKYLVSVARKVLKEFLKEKGPVKAPKDYPKTLDIDRGVFCTLYTHPNRKLRGCVGIPYPSANVVYNTVDAACSSTQDTRFPALEPKDLKKIVIELSVLTEPKPVEVDKPQDYLEKIELGKDGLIIKYDYATGLLLPQVPIEQGWDTRAFLRSLCVKAGLAPETWVSPNVNIYKFQAQIFVEKEPNGEVKEKAPTEFKKSQKGR